MRPIALPEPTWSDELVTLGKLFGGVLGTAVFFVATGAWTVIAAAVLA